MKAIFGSLSLVRIEKYFLANILLVSLLLLSGCAANNSTHTIKETVFYPPAPNPPRIQFLTTFASQRDMMKENSFNDFLFGEEDGAQFLLAKPYGVGMNNGQLIGVDTRGGAGYLIFDLKNDSVSRIDGSGKLAKPINITFDINGDRYISDTGKEQILVYDKNDNFVRAYGTKGQFKPTDTLIVEDKLYVVDIRAHKIKVIAKADGESLFEFGTPGANEGELYHPTNIALGGDGNIYISDTGNFRIQVFDPQGKYLRKVGALGVSSGQFSRPKGLSFDKNGNLYVVDSAFNNVQIFNPEGQLLLPIGGPGNGPGQLDLPADVSTDDKNVALFQKYAAPGFMLEHVIFVTSQFGSNKINVYGYGKMEGVEYPE